MSTLPLSYPQQAPNGATTPNLKLTLGTLTTAEANNAVLLCWHRKAYCRS
jgi:hypothetical protein